jgi:hypothetical protein
MSKFIYQFYFYTVYKLSRQTCVSKVYIQSVYPKVKGLNCIMFNCGLSGSLLTVRVTSLPNFLCA